MENQLDIYTDGGARGNPGPAAVGVVIKIKTDDEQRLVQFGKRIGETTNNVAEYTAVMEALQWIKDNVSMFQFSNFSIIFFLDSRLVVNQLKGLYKIKDAKLKELAIKVRELENNVAGKIFYNLIPREQNWQADKLVNRALDRYPHIF